MIFQLRRNTIMDDWYKAVDHYRYMIGYDINYAIVNIRTFSMIEAYMRKYGYDFLFINNYNYSYDMNGRVICNFNTVQQVILCGVNIIVDDSVDDEIVKFY